MKVDTYRSKAQPSYGLVVPAGTVLEALHGSAGAAIPKLSPLVPHSQGVELEDIFKGDLLKYLQAQIANEGAGLVKTEVRFDEVIGD